MVSQIFRLVRLKDGLELWQWMDGPPSCSCNDPLIERCLKVWERGLRWIAEHPPQPPPLPLPLPFPVPVP
jgi:hypothetical protein